MTVKSFYERINGNYEDILSRFSVDSLILHFVKRFPSDDSFAQLIEAVEKSDISASFEAAHKLKGVAANLAFTELFAAASELSNQLRTQTEAANPALVQKVCECYHLILREIECLEEA